MAYANPSTFVAGEVLTAAQQNVLANNDRFFHGPPTVRVERVAATTVANNTLTALTFTNEIKDNDTMWSSTASDRFKVRTAGTYLVGGGLRWASSTGGREIFLTRIVGTSTHFLAHDEIQIDAGDAQDAGQSIVTCATASTADVFRLVVRQISGGNLATIAGTTANRINSFWATWQSS